MSDSDRPEPLIFLLNRIPNALLVLVAIALLLQGPVGAFEALWGYTSDLARAIFGGEELLLQVLCQTAPLTLAVGAIVFSFRCGWISLASPAALMTSSVLILAGTWIGGELRSTASSAIGLVESEVTDSPTARNVRTVSTLGQTPDWLPSPSLSNPSLPSASLPHSSLTKPLGGLDEVGSDSESDTISITQAWAILSDLETVATDGSHHHWDQPVPRVALAPESETLWGFVGKSINQLLGYFVIYRPRLFLASILLGSYIGWSWQPYFESLRSWVRNRTGRPVIAKH